jgi:hypothetical protein
MVYQGWGMEMMGIAAQSRVFLRNLLLSLCLFEGAFLSYSVSLMFLQCFLLAVASSGREAGRITRRR